MKNILSKIKLYIVAHKIISTVVLILILLTGYWIYGKITSTNGETRYVLSTVSKDTIISSVTGSGQVSASNQIDLKARATGTITYVGVKAGDVVKKGKTLFSLDARDAKQTVNNAETNLETAKLDLEKFQQPPDSVAVLAIKKSITDAETSKLDAAQAIKDAYRNLLNSSITAIVSDSANTQTPPTISGTYIKDQEVTITLNVNQTGAGAYFNVSSIPDGLVSGIGNISTVVPQAIGDSGLYVKFPSINSSQPNWIITIPNKMGSAYYANSVAYQNAITNQKKVNDTADLTIAQNNKSLNDLYQPDSLTLRTKQLAVKQAEDSLLNAQISLSDYYVSAPFDGIIASVIGKVGDTTSGVLSTIITPEQIATIALNEVDIAKIQLGQKATLTFDAVSDLSITGKVVQIDSIGTASQGVVNYNVKISFDTNDARIKPGMSVSAAIITKIAQDVLVVPNSSIKTNNGTSYVQMFNTVLPTPPTGVQGSVSLVPPINQTVEIGISNNTSTEITSGLKEGDEIVSKIILPTAAKTTTPSILGSTTNRSGGGVRVP